MSSTFSDLKEERNALQREVFPKLRELCMEHGFRFQAIDLRWGVSEEAGLDQQTMKICLEEIERSQRVSPKPNFIVLLGDRYGWQPLPSEIEANEFNQILKELSLDEEELLLWKEEQSANEKGWYRLDENAVPAVYCLQPRTGDYADYDNWNSLESNLHSILLKAASKLDLSDDDFLKYQTSATEQEIIKGALKLPDNIPDAKEHVFCYFRRIDNRKDVLISARSLPQQIPKKEFDEIKKHLKDDSVTNYYKLKDNFYGLNHEQPPFNNKESSELENKILTSLENAVRKFEFDEDPSINDKIKEKYLASDFIDLTKIDDGKKVKYRVFDKKSCIKLQDLKNELNHNLSDNVHTYSAHWDKEGLSRDHIGNLPKDLIKRNKHEKVIENPKTLCEAVWNKLYKIIKEEIDKYQEISSLKQEILANKEFGKDRSRFFTGRENNLNKIDDYLKSSDPEPHMIYGESGSGKSALMAKAVQEFSPNFYKETKAEKLYDERLIVRFIGATPETSDLRSLLESLCQQITKIYDENDSKIPSEYNELVQDFKERLNFATDKKPLFIFLDGLDQLSDSENAHNLTWIPDDLKNVHIVISTLKENFKNYTRNRITYENSDELLELDENEGKSLLKSWFNDIGRKLTKKQYKEVITKFKDNGNPLYLKLAFEETKLLKSYTQTPNLASNISGITHQMFERLSKPENHGKILVSHSLGYLSASKNGLTEDEMLDIMARDTQVFSLTKKFHNPPEEKLPVALWSRLYFDLEPYLSERSADGTSLLTFYHRQLGEVVEEEYLTKNVKKERHQHLADYFYKQDLSFDKEGKKEFNIRKVAELPYHETYGEYWEHLEETLCDLRFVEAKCAVGRTYELIKDYYLALDMHPDAQEDYKKKLEDKKRVDKYINDLITYSKGEIDHLDIIPSVRPWTEEEIQKETERIINNPKPLDRIKAFSQFVNSQSHAFAEFGYMPSFCLQQAYNSANKGPIAKNAKKIIKENLRSPLILRDENWLPEYNPHQALIKILEGHTETVSAVAITPEGKTAITGSDDKTVRVWDLETGEQLQKIDSIETVSAVATTPEGKTAITGSDDKTVQVGDLETEEKLKKLSHKDRVSCAAVTPDGKTAITGSDDKTVRVWNLETGEQLQKINSTETVSAVAITPDGKKAILIFYDAVQVWDLEIRKLLKILRGHIYMMISVAITPDGKTAITGSNDGTLGIWNLETGKKGKKIGHSRSLNAITIAPDGKTAITGSDDKTVRVWNLETGEQLQKIDHNKKVSTVTITPDNKRLITGCHDGIVRVWNLETGEQLHKLDCTEWVNAVAITPEGKRLITGCRDGTVRVWDLETEEKILTLGYSEEGITFALNVDGKTIITQIDGTTLTLDEKETEETQLTIGHAENGSKVNITPDGKTALIQNDDKTVKVKNLDTGKLISIFNAKKQILILNHTEDIFHVTVTPDGKKVITGSDDGIIRVWDLETGKQLQKLGRKQWVEVVTVTPNGKTAITSDDKDNILLVWDLETGEQLQKLEHKKIVRVVAVTPDGKNAITGSDDRTVRVWNLESGRLIFISKEDLDIIALAIKRSSFLYGTFTGDLVFSYLVNIDIDIPLITASRIWLFEKNRCFGYWDDNITANCHCCWNRFKVSDEMLDRITEIKNQHKKPDGWIADEAWDDTRLISECPLCHEKIKFNPFIIDNSEEEFTKEINDN